MTVVQNEIKGLNRKEGLHSGNRDELTVVQNEVKGLIRKDIKYKLKLENCKRITGRMSGMV